MQAHSLGPELRVRIQWAIASRPLVSSYKQPRVHKTKTRGADELQVCDAAQPRGTTWKRFLPESSVPLPKVSSDLQDAHW
jgi:hypothetical protein